MTEIVSFYAKSAHLYLQEMFCLEERMDPTEYYKFTSKGYFTIRRTDKFWSGIWTDMTIEQTLMKNMKSIGGLTHGRGITDSTLMRWTLGMAYLQNISDEVEKFTNFTSASSEQHVEMRISRITRDNQDVQKLYQWLSAHPPFPKIDVVVSISSGVVGSEQVNCHIAQEIGRAGVSKIIGEKFGSVTFKKRDKVVSLASDLNSLKVGDKKVTVDPLTLFQRMCIAKQSEEDLQEYFTYELAPYPMSIFNEDGMRKSTKSSLYKAFSPLPSDLKLSEHRIVIVDGGFLLHKVVWNRNMTFGAICEGYVNYVQNHYGSTVIVIFDGYPVDPDLRSTKSAERSRRCKTNTSTDVIFDKATVCQVPQMAFLSNENNKKRLISLLKNEFEHSNITVNQAEEDADVLIVTTALSLGSRYDVVLIIGEDIDLLVVLTGLTPIHKNVYFQKPGKGNAPDTLYSASSFRYSSPENILLLHALSGCDTTSSIFGFGKTKFCTLFQNNPHLQESAKVFRNPSASASSIAEAGEHILVALYGGDTNGTLNSLRFAKFRSNSSKFNLAKLPPTEDAARYHAFRTYHQVLSWMGIKKNPLEWGWIKNSHGLIPVKTTRDAAPHTLLKCISCKCKSECSGTCGCRKAGLKCSTICKHCCGQSCENTPEIIIDDDNDEDETISVIQNLEIYPEDEGLESTFSSPSL